MTAKRQWLGVLAAVAVALGTLLPFFATYDIASASAKTSSLFGDKILICTGDGFALVKWSDLLAGKAPVKQDRKLACPLCYIAAHSLGKLLLPAGAALLLLRIAFAALILFSLTPCSRRFAYATACCRAPPASFIG